jgi:hypothetical protein
LFSSARIGQIWPLAADSGNVRLQTRKATFEPIAAPKNEVFVGRVGFFDLKAEAVGGCGFRFFVNRLRR